MLQQQYDVMVSYRVPETGSKERGGDGFAPALGAALIKLGYRVFVDVDMLQGGDDFGTVIQNAILSSKAQVAICSATYAADTKGFTYREYLLAETNRKEIIPIWYAGAWPPPNLSLYTAGVNYVPKGSCCVRDHPSYGKDGFVQQIATELAQALRNKGVTPLLDLLTGEMQNTKLSPSPATDVTWEQLGSGVTESGKKVLQDGGIAPAVARRMAVELGYTQPEDLEDISEAMVADLKLPPLQAMKLKKLIGQPSSSKAGCTRSTPTYSVVHAGHSSPALGAFMVPIEPDFDAWLNAQLAASPLDPKSTDEFTYINFTELPPFTVMHKSLMRKALTPELWASLKDLKTSKGYTLSNAIQAGVVRPHLGVGITCGDEECFTLFKAIIYPVVQGWHKFDPYTQVHKSDLDPSKLAITKAQAVKFSKYVVCTRMRAARNIAGFSLPAGATKDDRAGVEGVLKQAFASLPSDLAGTYYPLGSLTPDQEKILQAGGFLFQKPGPKLLLGAAGAGRDWPEGRGIFHNESKTVLAWCNEADHCRIISSADGGDIKGTFKRFCQLSHAIKIACESHGKSLMYNDQLGFLCTCPSNLGTGLSVSAMICVPNLNKHVHKLQEICDSLDLPLQPCGSFREHSEAVWDISSKQRLGFTEVELVQKLIDGISQILVLEEAMAAGTI